ncbi:MAG: 3-ketoacyl-ACP reductase [Lentisphaeria bacterium]|jgi:NAD(P)-dependent dehydrogenase (short-subunit alcohol dehydrogenase family)
MKRVALVTGGARGIGLGISSALLREGFALAVAGTKPAGEVAEPLRELAEQAQPGREVRYFQADISRREDRERLLAGIEAAFGALHLLVNNAGVAPQVRTDLLHASEESFDRVLGINLRGPYFLTQAAARWMIRQHQQDAAFAGAIVNVSSISAEVASVNRGEYCISKAGVGMATKLWAARLAEFGIGVYEVRPGIIATDMTAGVKEKYDQLLQQGLCLQARWGTPADVGKAVALLARGDLPYSTGQVLVIDGGLTLPRF